MHAQEQNKLSLAITRELSDARAPTCCTLAVPSLLKSQARKAAYGIFRLLLGVCRCILGYSDLSAETVLDIGARVMVAGADYLLLAPYDTFIRSTKPVSDQVTICCACRALEMS